MSSVFIFSYVFTLPQKANIFISGKLLRLDWKKKDRNQKMGAGKQLTALPGTHHPFSNDDGDLPNPCQFELGMAEGVGSEPTVRLPVRLISSQVPSTTQPPFQPPDLFR
jgi:hypothetical protein